MQLLNYKLSNDVNVKIGLRIREIRENLGYTREKFAELLDISESTLANIELGRTYISQNVLLSLYSKFGISSDDILHGTNKTNTTQDKINRIISSLNKDDCKYIYKIIVDILI